MQWKDHRCRCKWANPNNENYIRYHDTEWGIPVYTDKKLFEMLILESFQAGLSWECILNKREAFRAAFSQFDAEAICQYDTKKIESLMQNKAIIRNRRKINATITNAEIFLKIQKEYGSFSKYFWSWTQGHVIYEKDCTSSPRSDLISNDLKKRGMKFVGTTIIYAYMQAVGMVYGHEQGCFLEKK